MDFLTFFPKGKNMYVELIPDKLVHWQPTTDDEIEYKIKEVSPLVEQLREYCESRKIHQTVVIDCDKAIQFDKLNYILICKFVSELTRKYPDPNNTLRRIELRHCNSAVSGIYNASKPLLPKKITEIFHVYTN
jgi:hypothetical protein